ncbi:hypothetical protein NITGR_360009 [Nitrospina gracilis 3/211]|uniref:Uncharacterized protein n=1 Tax=Nitrospina gracilis (strain 3/211) TaxID=1266370 RepID=M1YYY7_NITG3|nr:hypothetical protein NITGR_360009 [Nitrospina gracilis 3/211]
MNNKPHAIEKINVKRKRGRREVLEGWIIFEPALIQRLTAKNDYIFGTHPYIQGKGSPPGRQRNKAVSSQKGAENTHNPPPAN